LSSDDGRRNSSHNRSVDCNGLVWSRVSARRVLFSFSRTCLSAIVVSCASCAFFHSQPALPKHAAIESRVTPEADEKFAALVQNADIIYFPTELLEPASRSEPAWKLVEALHRHGGSFAIGSDLIGGEGQALLDQWARQQVSIDNVISRLHLFGTARERENCRALVSETSKQPTRFLALRCPPELFAAPPQSPTREEIARSFHPPPGDFQIFADRFATARGMNEGKLREAYETALLEEEFTAERIVGHFREHGDEKLLVFLHRRNLGSVRGVPYFVAQKIKARQLVLDSRQHPPSRSQLLASTGPERSRASLGVTRRLEIVDGSPTAGRDQL
jgi:hypothetical protein